MSLLVFILLMCSCKTKESMSKENRKNRFISDISALSEVAKLDSVRVVKVAQIEEFTVIRESITTIEYDTQKEDNPIAKKTVEEREYSKGVQASKGEEMERKTTEETKDSFNQFVDVNEMVESETEVKEESVTASFWDKFGKWSGIGAVVVIVIALLWKKIKKVLPL